MKIRGMTAKQFWTHLYAWIVTCPLTMPKRTIHCWYGLAGGDEFRCLWCNATMTIEEKKEWEEEGEE